MRVRPSRAVLLLALVAALTGCSGNSEPDDGAAEEPAATTEDAAAPEPEPEPEPDADSEAVDDEEDAAASGPFRMVVLDSFTITGRDEPVVTGTIDSGTVRVGDELCLDGTAVTVAGIEAFREVLESASAGEDVGIALGGVAKDDVEDGMELAPC